MSNADEELKAIRKVQRILDSLPAPDARRILSYLIDLNSRRLHEYEKEAARAAEG